MLLQMPDAHPYHLPLAAFWLFRAGCRVRRLRMALSKKYRDIFIGILWMFSLELYACKLKKAEDKRIMKAVKCFIITKPKEEQV